MAKIKQKDKLFQDTNRLENSSRSINECSYYVDKM